MQFDKLGGLLWNYGKLGGFVQFYKLWGRFGIMVDSVVLWKILRIQKAMFHGTGRQDMIKNDLLVSNCNHHLVAKIFV